MDNLQHHAFTVTSTGILREIITEIGVSGPFEQEVINFSDPRILHTNALWDTGATNCVVTKKTANELKLEPMGLTKVSHVDGVSEANVYFVDIYLPNRILIHNIRVTECADNNDSFGVIIGMDVITKGDFAVTNLDGKTVVSYRMPSSTTIDFVKEGYIQTLQQNKRNNVGRNDPCPCGSNKKYKDCCLPRLEAQSSS
jgi:hypothetical protein